MASAVVLPSTTRIPEGPRETVSVPLVKAGPPGVRVVEPTSMADGSPVRTRSDPIVYVSALEIVSALDVAPALELIPALELVPPLELVSALEVVPAFELVSAFEVATCDDCKFEEVPSTSTMPEDSSDTVTEPVVKTAPGVRVAEPMTRLDASPIAVRLDPSVKVCWSLAVLVAVVC